MSKQIPFLFLLAFSGAVHHGYAQVLLQRADLFFHELNQYNGLSEQNNPYFFQDSKGFTWIGSFDGLNRFDGKNVKVYRPTLPDGSSDPNITSKVFEDKSGKLWFTTGSALYCIHPENDSLISKVLTRPGNATSPGEHHAFHLDSDSRLWVVADSAVHLLNVVNGKDTILHFINAYSCYPIVNSQGVVSGLVNLLVEKGRGVEIYRYLPNDMVKSTYFAVNDVHGFPLALILFANVEGDSILWLPSDIGVIRFPLRQPDRFEIFNPPALKEQVKFWDAASWGSRFLWLTSSNNGFFLFDKTKGNRGFVSHYTSFWINKQWVNLTTTNNIYLDRNETLWISNWGEGVFYSNLKQSKFTHLQASGSNSPSKSFSISSITEDKIGNIWCATGKEGMLLVFDKVGRMVNQISPWFNTNEAGIPDKLFCDRDGDIWALCGGAVFIKTWNNSKFKQLGKNLRRLNQIVQLDKNNFFLVCPTGLFHINKGEKIRDFLKDISLVRKNSLYEAFLDGKGNLYLSDEIDKLFVYSLDGIELKPLVELNGIGYSNGMVEDGNYRWVATNKGLLRIDISDSTHTFIPGKGSILKRSFNYILQDDSGNLWLSSNSGIFKFNPRTGEVKQYTESDGLQGLQFNLGSGCRLSDGRLAFGGVNGLNIFHPDSVLDNPNVPFVHITEIMVNDTGTLPSVNPIALESWTFPFSQRTVSFRFVAIEYSAPEENTFKYQLVGHDPDTVFAGTNGFARYANLPSGKYTLRVWAANSDGVWTPNAKELKIFIEYHWTNTWWFQTLLGLAIAGLLFGFYRFRIGQIKKREEMRRQQAEFKQKEAEFRQKEAELKQLAAETETAVLRLQMNPHFIFNSMNSINAYILERNVETASDYLTRFAKLMRMILKFAEKPFIAVSDEIELLEQYMKTEAMRLEKKFDYQVEVDEALDPDETYLPTMILQPFVENAIWHGISKKPGGGHIHIAFQPSGGLLLCSVEDNGAGRQTAAVEKTSTHESKAISLTERRLQLLEKEGKVKPSFEIIDLKDEAGNPAGTKIIVGVPLN